MRPQTHLSSKLIKESKILRAVQAVESRVESRCVSLIHSEKGRRVRRVPDWLVGGMGRRWQRRDRLISEHLPRSGYEVILLYLPASLIIDQLLLNDVLLQKHATSEGLKRRGLDTWAAGNSRYIS